MSLQVPGLEQQYQYGNYGQGTRVPFGGLTIGPRFAPQAAPVNSIEAIGTGELVADATGGSVGYNGPELRGGVTGAKFDTMQKYGFGF